MKYRQFKKTIAILLACVIVISAVIIPVGAIKTQHYISQTIIPTRSYTAGGVYGYAGNTITFNISWTPVLGTVDVGVVDLYGTFTYYRISGGGSANGYTFAFPDETVLYPQVRNLYYQNITVTGSYTVRNYSTRICYDSTTHSGLVSNMNTVFTSSTAPFNTTFGIKFSANAIVNTTRLNGGHTSNGGLCTRPNAEMCSDSALTCGKKENCNGNHHRNDERLINSLGITSCHVLGVVGHEMCTWEGGKHFKNPGIAVRGGRGALVSTMAPDLTKVVQHELSHNLGVGNHCDTHTANQPCIMKSPSLPDLHVRGIWCTYCSAVIRINN